MHELKFIAMLTLRSAIRMRFVLALSVILVASVILLPFLIKHNGTARMFTQVLVTYALSLITALLALSTLWLGCAAISLDLEGGQIQMLASKPVARWKIWLGKWMGIMTVQTLVLLVSGLAAYAVMLWRSGELSPGEREKWTREVLVARGSLRERVPDLAKDVEKLAEKRRKEMELSNVSREVLLKQVAVEVRAMHETVSPNYRRDWVLELGGRAASLRGKALSLRVQGYAAQKSADGFFRTVWVVGGERNPMAHRVELSLAPGVTHELSIPPDLFNEQGRLEVSCENRSGATLLFRLEDGLELLFPEGTFLVNYLRGLGVIWCWIALVGSLGVTAGAFLSFPVAAVLVVSLFLAGLSGETFAEVAREGTISSMDHETGKADGSLFDWIFVPMSRIFSLISGPLERVSPIAALSSGRSIPWSQVAAATGQVVLLFGGTVALAGMIVFTRREISRPS